MSNVVTFPGKDKEKKAEIVLPQIDPSFGYAELAVTTHFSFLRGASGPDDLVRQAAALGLTGIGIADRNSVAGVVRAYSDVEQINARIRELNDENKTDHPELKLAVGARLVFADGTPDILAYPQNRTAWGRLTRLLTVGKSRGEKAECILFLEDLLEHIAGQNLIVMPPARFRADALGAVLERLKPASLRQPVWLAASMLYRGDDNRRLARLKAIAETAFVPLIAVNDVLYHVPERRALQDVMTCIREHVTIDTAGRRLEANAERHLKGPQEMARIFRRAPDAVDRTLRFLDRCNFSLSELENTEYPDENREGYATPYDALVALAEEGFRRRYPGGAHPKVREALNKELKVTSELGYAPYFLTVQDIVRFARSRGILCQGRGSAANSVICYCLEITEVDPEKVDLLFERFVSEERKEPPDIDVDFEHDRREEVIQHVYEKYGRNHANLTATVICYRGRSAIREVGKVFGLSDDTVGALAGMLWGWSQSGVKEQEARKAGLDPDDPRLNRVMQLADELIDTPRHLSQHPGGFLITRSRIDEVVPVENARMDERTVIEWEKDDLEALRLLKVDVLGLGMLSCLRRGFDLLRIHYGRADTLPHLLLQEEDEIERKPVYQMIQRADTLGTFQIESRAQMSMLPRLQPKEFYDLVIEVAIVRPGPIQGKMVHPYLQRREAFRDAKEEPPYPSPSPQHGDKDELRSILKKTLGIPLFQEQAMRIAIVAAKFTPEEANGLRRAMATFKRKGTIEDFQRKFIEGMTGRGYDPGFAASCFDQIRGFGEYGFPESHAASFANLVYVSCWMKCYYPDVFAAALLNSQPMGFYAPAQIVRDAREHGVEVRPADVNLSDWDCTLELIPPLKGEGRRAQRAGVGSAFEKPPPPDALRASTSPLQGEVKKEVHLRHAAMKGAIRGTHALRLGLRQISGLAEAHALRIESRARPRLRLGARSVAAHAAAGRGAGAARQCRRVRLARPVATRRAVGGARAAACGRQGRPAAVRARRNAGARAGCRAPRHAGRRAGGRGLSPSASVAEGASGVVPARRPRPPRHHAARTPAGHQVRRNRHGRRARAGAPAPGHREGRDLHDAGG